MLQYRSRSRKTKKQIKAAGADGIFPEFLKNPGEKGRIWLVALFTAVQKQRKFLQPGIRLML